MDQLFKRYADPFSFMDGMIQADRFPEFVDNFVKTLNQEREEELNLKVWLHKVYDKSFNEFVEELKTDSDNQNMTASQIETTVTESLDILNNFTPQGGE